MKKGLTPKPRKDSPDAMTMSFFDAIRKVDIGKKIARISWANSDYCFMKDSWLTIFTKNEMHTWLVSEGDMQAQDWIEVTDLN